MQELQQEGCEVFAAGQMPEADWLERFASIGVAYRQIKVSRNGLNPLDDIQTYFSIRRLLKEIRPDKIFVFQAKTIAYGCRAAASLGITEVYTLLAGLGSVYLGHGLKNRLVKFVMSALYKQAFKRSRKVFFQNQDDKSTMIGEGLLSDNQVKGVGEYLEACQKIKRLYQDRVRCLLVGPYDSNPSALKPEELQPLVNQGVIEYFGEQTDVRPFISQCSIYVLPSYHEGTPKTVIEAMAMGRAIITTDVPGCRETVVDGRNGYLVEVKNVDAIVDKMVYLVEHPKLVEKMGQESREMACEIFDVRKVNDTILRTMGIRK